MSAPQNKVIHFRHKHRNRTILQTFYLNIGLWMVGMMAISVVFFYIIMEGDKNAMLVNWGGLLWGGLVAVLLTTITLLVEKGSLVESMDFDFEQREIRVVHYRLPNKRCQRTIPFDGLRWRWVQPRDLLAHRLCYLRITPKEGKKLCITCDHLGWNCVNEIMDALQCIVESDVGATAL